MPVKAPAWSRNPLLATAPLLFLAGGLSLRLGRWIDSELATQQAQLLTLEL